MNSPAVTPKAPVNSAELDNVIYEIANMLKTIPPKKAQKAIRKLKNALTFRYVFDEDFGDVIVIYSTAPFSADDNVKFRQLLTKLTQILNNIMQNLTPNKKRKVINYIAKQLSNIVLSNS
ncbi:MAG: hypothetical protein QXX36_03560 [Candidatus Rehaiarchaeum fermentans]|nr:hypothetical protein [Candidatus Rehaiarchaeum fermentans]